MARPSGPLDRCGGRWTTAKFNSFIKNQLRQSSRKWAPINDCKKAANIRRGWYLCAGCGEEVPTTTLSNRKRVKNIFVDHIDPIVPVTGWVSWDHCINQMFCEEENLQVLCSSCHTTKTAEEAALRKTYRYKE